MRASIALKSITNNHNIALLYLVNKVFFYKKKIKLKNFILFYQTNLYKLVIWDQNVQ